MRDGDKIDYSYSYYIDYSCSYKRETLIIKMQIHRLLTCFTVLPRGVYVH